MKRRELLKGGATLLGAGGILGLPASVAAAAADDPYGIESPVEDARCFRTSAVDLEAYRVRSRRIVAAHWRQTREQVAALDKKYEKPLYGPMPIWDLVEKSALCIDIADMRLLCVSQLVHLQQTVEQMDEAGVTDPVLLAAAVLHDLGKVLLLEGEAPENVCCGNRPIGTFTDGCGLDNITINFNHDRFMYLRLRGHVPDEVAWLVRYHSLHMDRAERYMNDRDRDWTERYLKPFRRLDLDSKSPARLPAADTLARCREIAEKALPKPLVV